MRLVLHFSWACLLLVVAASAVAQTKDACRDEDSRRAWDSGSDPIYVDAMQLADKLQTYGFVVDCVRSSKQADLFEGQKGAAWYKTKQGVFEVLFLQEGQTWDGLEVVDEATIGGRHNYRFRGAPRTSSGMDGAKPITFIRHRNLMFEVLDDEELAKRIRGVFPGK